MVDEEILLPPPRRGESRSATRFEMPSDPEYREAMTELLLVGTSVELREPLYGYPSGARGVVVRIADGGGAVLVRFDDTGHAMFVGREALRVVDRGSAT
jgi:hypothetical protein